MFEKLKAVFVFLSPYIGRLLGDGYRACRDRPKHVPGAKMPWNLTVVVMDGTDMQEQAKVPVTEAVKFIEDRTRFRFNVRYVETDVKHDLTPYDSDMRRYAMMGWNIPNDFIKSLPVSTSYLFLYKLGDNEAAQAGSALGLDFGLLIGGKPRPYCTVATDQRWYINTPINGFQGWAAQILTHEIINTIQAKVEAAPYNCGQLTGTEGVQSNIFEAQRLGKLTDKIYEALGENAD